ncbi:cation:proton antiporter [Aeromonas veronii]|uniref:cation:proton antiporter domain-containing protein n=1 Tax=Aeromonas veronii TaxID=654 RepID=UPI003D21F36B
MDAHLLYQNLAVIAAFLLVYSLIAGRFESKLVNGPLLFLLTGWLLGPGGLELLSLSIDSAGIKLLAELTLVIVLFNDAANTNWQVLLANRQLPIRLLKISYLNGWQLPLWRQLTMPGLALLCFALAQTLGGSGFIAAFVGGLFIGHRLGEHKHAYMDSCEGYGDLLSVVIWMVFGATLMPILPELLHWQYWLYAIASLTLLRMVPVWLSLIGTGLKPELKLFIGWFGPRGLASIVFAVMVLQNEPALIGQRPIIATVLCTIILSVILHGLTANPWVERFKPR